MKEFNGKAIYQPKSKAKEYAEWACNFYVGCSNECTYCYLRKGVWSKTFGGNKPTLKTCFKDESDAIEVFNKEILKHKSELQKSGLFFSFTTDPMLPETKGLTMEAIQLCILNRIPVKILTKRADWTPDFPYEYFIGVEKEIAFGFTLTGHNEREPYASTNTARIMAMKQLYNKGFKTFASIEPVITLDSSFRMIQLSAPFCDLFKVGLQSGKANRFTTEHLNYFVKTVISEVSRNNKKVYFKDSITFLTGQIINNCVVNSDYNLFG